MLEEKKTASLIIPVKKFEAAKSRLGSLFSKSERKQIAQYMLEDVLQTITSMRERPVSVVVSNDISVKRISEKYNVNYVKETKNELNGAVSEAIKWCLKRRANSVLIIPSDIPLVQPKDLEKIFSLKEDKSIVIVCSKDGEGTNALLLTPPKVIATFYGQNSFQQHLAIASKLNVKRHICRMSNIEFDLDTETDLKQFMSNPSETKTYKELIRIKKRKFFDMKYNNPNRIQFKSN